MFRLVLESHDGRAPGADSEEKHEPVSDIDTGMADSLKVLDPDGRLEKWSWLKAWAIKIARHRGMKKAIVALARRLAVIMHRIWVDGTEFRWTREQATAAA